VLIWVQVHLHTELAARLALLAAILSTARAQQAPEQQKPGENPNVQPPQIAQQQPIMEDLSHGATFKLKIAADLPEFTFNVVPEVQKPDKAGNPITTIQDVQVFRGTSKQPVQSLEDCEWEGMDAPPRGSDWLRAEDMNFDAYKDIFVLTNWGATGNQLGCVWLSDPSSRRFDYSKEFSELGTFAIDPATKTITTHGNGGMAGTVFRGAKYVVENNRPVPVTTVAHDFDSATKKYHCVVQQRREGKFVTVRDVWAEPNANFNLP